MEARISMIIPEDVLSWTGERLTFDAGNQVKMEHFHRYFVIRKLASAQMVLDVACGEGYGSAILSQSARHVYGLDINKETIAHAKKSYKCDNLSFVLGDISFLPFDNDLFDLVVSFETIEHVENYDAVIEECKRVLKPNGVLVISTPNKPVYAKNCSEPNPYHKYELSYRELSKVLNDKFKYVNMLGQKYISGSIMMPISEIVSDTEIRPVSMYTRIDDFTFIESNRMSDPVYHVAFASDRQVSFDHSSILEGGVNFMEAAEAATAIEAYRSQMEIWKAGFEKASNHILKLDEQMETLLKSQKNQHRSMEQDDEKSEKSIVQLPEAKATHVNQIDNNECARPDQEMKMTLLSFKKTICVIANCHCLPIARLLALGTQNCLFDFIDVNQVNAPPFKERIEKTVRKEYDMILSLNLSDDWGSIATSRLREIYNEHYRTFLNIHFDGLHPDMTYLGSMGSRISGPMVDYHSKIILSSFLAGRSQAECKEMFCHNVFDHLGYFDRFDHASNELIKRDRGCDIHFSSSFIEKIQDEYCLYTFNHPTDSVFLDLCSKICSCIDVDFKAPIPQMLTNFLSESVVWPVYEEIALFHNLKYELPSDFYKSNNFESRSFSLQDTISLYYKHYGDAGPGLNDCDFLETDSFKSFIKLVS